MNIGLLKYKVKPPNTEMTIPPINGTYGIFSTKYIIAMAIMVATINGGIATIKLLSLL